MCWFVVVLVCCVAVLVCSGGVGVLVCCFDGFVVLSFCCLVVLLCCCGVLLLRCFVDVF